MTARVRVVGLGPGGPEFVTPRANHLLHAAAVARLRTRVHPAARDYADVVSYDDRYETASSFEELYRDIADDLVALAQASPDGEVVYAVPGSPVVAERTVELLRARGDVEVVTEAAVSVIDVACAALRRDPMASGLRVLDALESSEPLRGPGPLLVLQTYSSEILAQVASRLPPTVTVTVLHHLGLADEALVDLAASDLTSFRDVDHLTSLWIDGLRTSGEATDDLVDFTRRLRRECPWDQEQTHASLTRHLLEEAYEALDALEALARAQESGEGLVAASEHAEEELGDLLFQIVFHAELADEEGLFSFATLTDAVRDKLTGRHPHVFGDVRVEGADHVAARWEVLKRAEKGRESVLDGVAWQLPSLALYDELLRRRAQVLDPGDARAASRDAHAALRVVRDVVADPSTASVSLAWGDVLVALATAARACGVNLEGVLRERAQWLRDDIGRAEAAGSFGPGAQKRETRGDTP